MPSLTYRRRLSRALAENSERTIHAFLKREQRPLFVAFAHGWHRVIALPEFSFGTQYRADFLVLSAHSGAWHAEFVELESPGARLYLRDGTESKLLRTALRQAKDWGIWLEQNDTQFRRDMRRALEQAAVADPKVPTDPSNYSTDRLLDPRTVVWKHFSVVIGRRASLSATDQERRAFEYRHGVQIVTYDRLIDIAVRDAQGALELRQARREQAGTP